MTQAVMVSDFAETQKTSYCIDLDTRDRKVVESSKRGLPRLEAAPDHDERIAVVCYGPTLEDTWEQLREFKYIITCSGAHKFLIDRGIIPTWHAEVDPRPHKADLIGEPHPDVEYLIASVCDPKVFDMLRGHKIKVWHIFAHEAARHAVPVAYPRGEWSLTGGSNVGLRCMVLARFMGFRKMTVFGMDYSFKSDGTQHAGWHPKEIPHIHAVSVGERTFYTNPAMHLYAQQFFKEVTKLGDIEVDVVGDALLQAKIREHLKTGPLIPKAERPSMIAALTPEVASPEYLELNRQLHATNPEYGISGSKRAEVVRRLIATVKPETVLDYGCGKGTLAQALDRPIWEYDPAIPGKDAPPRPADLVICTDVLEHIEPEYLDAVLLDLSRVTLKVCYALIYTGPAKKTLADGRNAHLIQQPMAWWNEQLGRYFSVAKIEENGHEVTVILGPKKAGEKAKVIAPPLDFSSRVTPNRHDGTEVKFYTPNDMTHWRARTLFTKEPATIEWIDSFASGDILWDVGANVGGYTVWAAKRRGCKVYAFEPEAGNYAILNRNMTLNNVEGAAYCVALTDQPNVSTIYLATDGVGGSCNSFGADIGPDLKERKGIRQGAVGLTLNALAHSLPHPDHIKIDVDGLEHKVLAGGESLLKSGSVKSILVEVNTNLPEHMAMLESLKALGYSYDEAQFLASQRKEGPFKGCGECVLLLPVVANPVEDYVLARIADAPIIELPFPHLYLEDVFPADFYESLVAALPTDGYKSLEETGTANGYPQRFIHDAPDMLKWMRNGKLRAALDNKFGVKSKTDETRLIRDFPGYHITPHTDTPSKVVSALFYTPRAWTEAEHGTSIYCPLIRSFTDTTGKHFEREGFRLAWTAPGKPNSAFIFARTDNSFHGAEPYEGAATRDILLYDSRK